MIEGKQKILGVLDLIRQAFSIYKKTGDTELANDRLVDAHNILKEIVIDGRIESLEFDDLLIEYANNNKINDNTKNSIGEIFSGFMISLLDDDIEGCIVCFK